LADEKAQFFSVKTELFLVTSPLHIISSGKDPHFKHLSWPFGGEQHIFRSSKGEKKTLALRLSNLAPVLLEVRTSAGKHVGGYLQNWE
jgi:hypothetical protein